jgi:hypothetical protein
METLELFFILSLLTQLVHSAEELTTGFHRKWYLFTMPFWLFLLFEICFSVFFLAALFSSAFPFREAIQAFFIVLMFANGVQHIVWWGSVKTYVPGLITAPIHVGVFLAFYFGLLF